MKPSYFCWQNLLFADETELTVPQLAGDQWVSMNGTNMKFSISDASAPGLDLGADGSSFAIEVIITTPETMPSSLVRIGGKDAPGIYAFFLEYRNTADMMQFYIASSSTTAAVDMQPAGGWAGGTKYRLNMYFHSGNKLVGFIDGTKVAETTTAITTVKNSSSDFHVGARSDNSRYWPGKIHQFRIAKNWGSFPTDGSELDPDRDNLISDWIFDGLNGAGGTVKDNSSSGYHLTPTNVTERILQLSHLKISLVLGISSIRICLSGKFGRAGGLNLHPQSQWW